MSEDSITQNAPGPTEPPSAGQSDEHVSLLGDTLAPLLRAGCGGRLGPIRWFRTDWQRGGALTGYADFADRGRAVVKLPVPPQELMWLERLQHTRHGHGRVVPELWAEGSEVGSYDFAWVVIERLEHGPLDGRWGGSEVELLLDVAARFYAAAEAHACDRPPRDENWPDAIRRARQAVREHAVPEEQRWNAAIKSLGKQLPKLLATWDARDTGQWCHGDLHFGNAMTLSSPPGGPALLFDLARIHAGHWIEDAVYFEHLFWALPDRLGGIEPAKHLNRKRKERGLSVEASWPRLAEIRRALLAAAAPLELDGHASPAHLRASLTMLERLLGRL